MQDKVERVLLRSSDNATFWGAILSVVGSVSAEWVFGFIGVAIALLGVLVNRYYTRKRDRREAEQTARDEVRKQELHQARLEFLRRAAPLPGQGVVPEEILEARLLGIDTQDFPCSGFQELK